MSEEKFSRNLDPFNFSIAFGIFNQKTETLYNQNEQQGRQWETLPDSTGGQKKGSRITIYEDNKVGRRDTAQNPIYPNKRNPDLNKNKTDKGPINTIKGFR